MGIAAYNRGSRVIANQITRDKPFHSAFSIMDRINALPKFKGNYRTQLLDMKHQPFSDEVIIEYDRGVWWMMDPVKLHDGFSYFYRTLEDLIRSWDIYLVGYNETNNTWTAKSL